MFVCEFPTAPLAPHDLLWPPKTLPALHKQTQTKLNQIKPNSTNPNQSRLKETKYKLIKAWPAMAPYFPIINQVKKMIIGLLPPVQLSHFLLTHICQRNQ